MDGMCEDRTKMTSQQALCVSDADVSGKRRRGISTLKMFIVALSFAYFCKTLTGTFMKSSITQLERRFDLSSSHIGLIDGSFEMGNLLFLAVVSHFGTKMHRPRLIAGGSVLMAAGALLTGLTHFFMGPYKYETVITAFQNDSTSPVACLSPENDASHWNQARPNATQETVTISPNDARWVGAWWMGMLVSAGLLFLSSLPFWFFPRSPEVEEAEATPVEEIPDARADPPGNDKTVKKIAEIAQGFLPSLRQLLCNPVYFLLICGSTLKFNSLVGMFTFNAKYIEQQFGQSASRANFLIGVLTLPAVAMGIFLGGVVMKRYKLSVVSGAQFSFAVSLGAYLLMLLKFGTKCHNIPVAGLTASYNGTLGALHGGQALFSECNRNCSCSAEDWDPVCSDSGITYISPCMASCLSYSGFGKKTVFHNCTCVSASFPAGSSTSVKLGQCPQAKSCSRSFSFYMAVSVLSAFISSLGITPAYMVTIRCISPHLKSLALGMQTMIIRVLGKSWLGNEMRSICVTSFMIWTFYDWFSTGGIPAPIYFGAFIDLTCLKWSVKKCGGRGACRLYDANMYRVIFLGLVSGISGISFFFAFAVIILLRKQSQNEEDEPKALKQMELHAQSRFTDEALNARAAQEVVGIPKNGVATARDAAEAALQTDEDHCEAGKNAEVEHPEKKMTIVKITHLKSAHSH
ncbi:solute carrier organic anion transporter family member 1C1-like isoform X3 [Syngnathoides biaculeatus]|uniref:solute carrier organic anion transporter family member 1C1-like isoform X3 n=1 Tax=Syngnathoides biaculeatus TaxID=300417 RepID=UPI002ADD7CB8|nr:solute carrier organic anion transporter family member 1C1-like isoform X3 [Syngnathoides biaculeatus]